MSSLKHARITSLLESVQQQQYPLEITTDAAEALVECIRRIMSEVPEDDQVFVRADYDLATSALLHPTPTNINP